MKIDKTTSFATLPGVEALDSKRVKPASSPQQGSQVSTNISTVPADGEFDQAKVDKVVAAIRAGELQFNPEKIADGLLASTKALTE